MTDTAALHGGLPSIITIDGPAGAGKSTIGALLAERLGYRYFDTGVLYRAVALVALRRQVPVTDEARLAEIAATMDLEFVAEGSDHGRHYTVRLGGEDVTWALRQPGVNEIVSTVAAYPAVRGALLERQRVIGRQGRIVMVGRDIGTVVLPEADLKIYLDASEVERARRRHAEQLQRGEASDQAAVLATVRHRDQIDSQRATSPLRPAPDAIRVDTDRLNIDEVLQCIGRHLGIRAGQPGTRPPAQDQHAAAPGLDASGPRSRE